MNVRNKQAQVGSVRAQRATVAGTVLLLMQLASAAHAGPNEQAKRIYERIAGGPPSAAELSTMVGVITAGCGASGCAPGSPVLAQAAATATAARGFYNVTLKNLVMPWTNRDQTVFAPLNDYTATVIGMVRDDVDFNTALSADILYTVKTSGLPAPSTANNDHYANAEAQRRQPADRPQARHAVGNLRFPGRGDRRCDHDPRRGVGVLHQRHQPRDVPLHDDQSPVPRHGAGDGHHASLGPHPPGRGALPGRRQPHLPEPAASAATAAWIRWRRPSRTTTSTRLRTRWSTPPARCSRSTSSTRPTSRSASSRRTTAGQIAGAPAPTPTSAGTVRCRAAASAPSRWVRNSPTATCSPSARSRRCSRRCASARPNSAADMATVTTIKQSFKANGYKLKQVFAQSAAACAGS